MTAASTPPLPEPEPDPAPDAPGIPVQDPAPFTPIDDPVPVPMDDADNAPDSVMTDPRGGREGIE